MLSRKTYTNAHASSYLEHLVSLDLRSLPNMKSDDAVSTGLGFGMGLALTNYMFQTMKPYGKTAKLIIICLKCQGRNALENEFCWHCGSALYPQSRTQCTKCKATVPSMKYCGNCGSKLKKQKQKRKKESIFRG